MMDERRDKAPGGADSKAGSSPAKLHQAKDASDPYHVEKHVARDASASHGNDLLKIEGQNGEEVDDILQAGINNKLKLEWLLPP